MSIEKIETLSQNNEKPASNLQDFFEIQLTPENIADRYYGDSTLHWIVLLTNNILDPYFDFPLNYRNFVEMLIQG